MTDVQTRREIRRQKILENSEKRLMKISGVEKRSTKADVDGVVSSSFQDQNELVHSNLVDFENSATSSNHTHDLGIASYGELETIFNNPLLSQNESISTHGEPVQQKSPKYFYLFIMPILISFLLVICDIFQIDTKYFYFNKIFIPLIAFEIIDLCSGSSVNSAPNFLSSIILLTGNRNSLIGTYSTHVQIWFRYISKFVQDVMIYFFVFIVSYTLMEILVKDIDSYFKIY